MATKLTNPETVPQDVANKQTASGDINGWAYSIPPGQSLELPSNTDQEKGIIQTILKSWPMLKVKQV